MSPKEKKQDKSDRIIFPATKVAVEEEFLPSKGTHIENHEVQASVFGEVFLDRKSYRAKVYSIPKGSPVPKRFDIVIGSVDKVSRSSVRISISYVNDKYVEPSYSAIMHISDASKDYIKIIDDYYVSGDIVRANVIDAKSIPLQLECKKSNTGVIYSFCIKCGEYAKKVKKDLLQCTSCNTKQSRKTAIDYGKINLVSNL